MPSWLRAQGAALTLVCRSTNTLEALALKLADDRVQPHPRLLQMNLPVPEKVLDTACHLAEHVPRLDLLVHRAAVYHS